MGIPTLISTSTASGASSVDITSGIDSTYDEYMFVLTDINPATAQNNFTFQVNANGQSGFNETITSTAFGAYQREDGEYPTLSYQAGQDQAQGTGYQQIMGNLGTDTDESGACILHLFRPSNTTYVKHFYSRMGEYISVDRTSDNFAAGYFNTTAAIDDIQFKMSSGNMDAVIKMYGVS